MHCYLTLRVLCDFEAHHAGLTHDVLQLNLVHSFAGVCGMQSCMHYASQSSLLCVGNELMQE